MASQARGEVDLYSYIISKLQNICYYSITVIFSTSLRESLRESGQAFQAP